MKIFVSYRREDTGPFARRLCQRLDDAFGARNVFFDERSVPTGGDFRGTVVGNIVMSDVILVLIGHSWTTAVDDRGKPRVFDEDDPIYLEVGMSMRRNLIPLLVDGARMPAAHALPDIMRDLPGRSGMSVYSDHRFDACVDDLIQRLGGPTPVAVNQPLGSRAPRATTSWLSFEGHWQTRDGGWAEILQNGNQIEMNGWAANGGQYSAWGTIQGAVAVLEFQNSFGLRGQLVMQLVENGAYINGQVQSMMGVSQFDMMRRN
jgi:hypothetical protein